MDIIPSSLQEAVEIVGKVAGTLDKLLDAKTRLEALFKGSKHPGEAEVKLAIVSLMYDVADARATNADLKGKITAALEELREVQRFQMNLDRYALWETPGGATVYRLKDSEAGEDPVHLLCPHCAAQRRTSILQPDAHGKICHPCGATFRMTARKSRKT